MKLPADQELAFSADDETVFVECDLRCVGHVQVLSSPIVSRELRE
jgi:hypothetical protein